jgi:hypothetical protein
MRWLIPILGVGVLVWAVVLAFQGRFAVAFAIGVFAGCCFQLDRLRSRLNRN